MKRSLKSNKVTDDQYQDSNDLVLIDADNSSMAESERFVKRLKLQIDVIKRIIDPVNNHPDNFEREIKAEREVLKN